MEIESELYRFIFSFHMFAFYFASGITFSVKPEHNAADFIKDYARKLLIPYAFYAFLWDIVNIVKNLFLGVDVDFSLIAILKNILDVIVAGGSFESSASIGPAWFLVSLFCARIIFYAILRGTKENKSLALIICVAFFFIGFKLNGCSILPFKIIPTLTAMPFLCGGYLSKPIWDKISQINSGLGIQTLIFFVLLLLTGILSHFADADVLLISNVLPSNPMLLIVTGFTGCFCLAFLAHILERFEMVAKPLIFYGQNSMIIMGVHSEINVLFRLIFYILGVGLFARVCLIMCFTLILAIPICSFVNIYIPALAGRKTENSTFP